MEYSPSSPSSNSTAHPLIPLSATQVHMQIHTQIQIGTAGEFKLSDLLNKSVTLTTYNTASLCGLEQTFPLFACIPFLLSRLFFFLFNLSTFLPLISFFSPFLASHTRSHKGQRHDGLSSPPTKHTHTHTHTEIRLDPSGYHDFFLSSSLKNQNLVCPRFTSGIDISNRGD